MLKTMTKNDLREERLHFSLWLSRIEQPEQELKTEPGARTKAETEEHRLLACFPAGTRPAFLHSQGPLSKGGTAHSRMSPPTTNNKSRQYPTDMPTGKSDRNNSLMDVLSSQMSLIYVNLTKTNQHTGQR